MAKSLLAAVHNAVAGTADDAVDDSQPGAPAPHQQKEASMAAQSQPAGGDSNPGISKADHDTAVTAARAEGKAEGEKSATERLSAALGADGVKGDACRMAAALDLAVKSPGMSGADVAAFVTANVAAAKSAGTAADYAANRTAAAGLAQPQGGPAKKATIDTSGIYAARRKQQEA